jgi:CheY-like chemotaxis protein
VQELAGEALYAAVNGADLTKRLLAFARRQPLQPKLVDVNQLITGIARLLSRTLGEGVRISLDLSPQLWPTFVDPTQLEAALINLANNARDAMPKGGTLTIVTRNGHLDADYASNHPGVVVGDYAGIEVTDTGTGMSPEVLEKAFEPFFTTKATGKGSGLGLSMVYGFLKQSGGHVNIYSEVGIGSTFRLYLPRAHTQERPKQAEAAPENVHGRGETVLAVEDNPSLRRVVVRQLRELGYRVLEAENAAAAMMVLNAEPVDILFTDVVMGQGANGFELAHSATVKWPNIRVLITSGFPDATLNGGDKGGGPPLRGRILTKPYRKEDLARSLKAVLGD